MAEVKVIRNADRTITIRIGRYVEQISDDKTPAELYDAIMWACVTGGASIDDSLWDHVRELIWGETK